MRAFGVSSMRWTTSRSGGRHVGGDKVVGKQARRASSQGGRVGAAAGGGEAGESEGEVCALAAAGIQGTAKAASWVEVRGLQGSSEQEEGKVRSPEDQSTCGQ